jgi:NTP pyrophosphatase (non-canonical NTP hydrolase)
MENLDPRVLNHAVIVWAKNKGIFKKGTVKGQLGKFVEESQELEEEVRTFLESGAEVKDMPEDLKLSIMKEAGDVVVTVSLLSEMLDFDIFEAYEKAYKKISKREGEMVNGVFVKSEDLNK